MKARVDKVLELARFVLRFSRVERNTFHEDGERPETDADHTVMLAVMACALAREVAPQLDLGKVAQFALVHDLVEAYAGDTVTLKVMSERDYAEKREREAAALVRVKEKFSDSFPWIHETIEEYESLSSPEARFVKTVDKAMPGVTHILNGGTTFSGSGHSRSEVDAIRAAAREHYPATFAYDQPEAMAFWEAIIEAGASRIRYPGDDAAPESSTV